MANRLGFGINTKQLLSMGTVLKKRKPQLLKAIGLAFENSLEQVKEASKDNKYHRFITKSTKLENSVEVTMSGDVANIFAPSKGPNGVAYGPTIYLGSEVVFPNINFTNPWKPDPFIENAYKGEKNKVYDTFAKDMRDQIAYLLKEEAKKTKRKNKRGK